MISMICKKLALVTAALLLAGNTAMSAPITAAAGVDFTNHTTWGGANGAASHTAIYDTVKVTLTASGGTMTINGSDKTGWGSGVNCSAPTSTGLACDGDGIGISDDEITGNLLQVLTVSFTNLSDAPIVVLLAEIEILDLFAGGSADTGGEIAHYKLMVYCRNFQLILRQ